jgi:hypothetical protein
MSDSYRGAYAEAECSCDREPPRLRHLVSRILSHDAVRTVQGSFAPSFSVGRHDGLIDSRGSGEAPRMQERPVDGCGAHHLPLAALPRISIREAIRPRHRDGDICSPGRFGLEIIDDSSV